MQLFLQTYIHNAYPNNINLVELKEVIDLVRDFIYTLQIDQLQAIEIPGPTERSIKHIDLRPILSSLLNLEVSESSLIFLKNIFSPYPFQFLHNISHDRVNKFFQESSLFNYPFSRNSQFELESKKLV